MRHAFRVALGAALLVAAGAQGAGAATGGTATARTLTYTILMGDDPVGTETVRLEPLGDALKVDVSATSRVKVLFISFRYDHQREELWKGGALQSMQAKTDDDGTPHAITLARQGAGYAMTVDGKTAEVAGTALPLTLWTPEVLKRPTLLSVVDGKPYTVRVETLGPDKVEVGGKLFEAQHHRISGDVDRDLWFAADGTLLKTRFKKSGYDVTYILK